MERSEAGAQPPEWSVYMLRCADGSLYTGIAKDVGARLAQHSKGKGAAYTRSRLPVALAYAETGFTRSQALVREARLKGLARKEKEKLLRPIGQPATNPTYCPPSRRGTANSRPRATARPG
ncbi:MAG: GIY-YIG nuclease family protein [Elusimicrobia bacterium]|nr:GIY-YIG nuclease family protein [Elusimicrobiota bacterium]